MGQEVQRLKKTREFQGVFAQGKGFSEGNLLLKVKLAKVDDFLAAMGVKKEEAQPKLMVKMRDLPTQDTKVAVLKQG